MALNPGEHRLVAELQRATLKPPASACVLKIADDRHHLVVDVELARRPLLAPRLILGHALVEIRQGFVLFLRIDGGPGQHFAAGGFRRIDFGFRA